MENYCNYHEEFFIPGILPIVHRSHYNVHMLGLTQSKLAEMLGLSNARISEIITGKGEPSLKTGREISRRLNIDPAIVLGV